MNHKNVSFFLTEGRREETKKNNVDKKGSRKVCWGPNVARASGWSEKGAQVGRGGRRILWCVGFLFTFWCNVSLESFFALRRAEDGVHLGVFVKAKLLHEASVALVVWTEREHIHLERCGASVSTPGPKTRQTRQHVIVRRRPSSSRSSCPPSHLQRHSDGQHTDHANFSFPPIIQSCSSHPNLF